MTKRIAAALVEAEGMEAALPGTPSFDVSARIARQDTQPALSPRTTDASAAPELISEVSAFEL